MRSPATEQIRPLRGGLDTDRITDALLEVRIECGRRAIEDGKAVAPNAASAAPAGGRSKLDDDNFDKAALHLGLADMIHGPPGQHTWSRPTPVGRQQPSA